MSLARVTTASMPALDPPPWTPTFTSGLRFWYSSAAAETAGKIVLEPEMFTILSASPRSQPDEATTAAHRIRRAETVLIPPIDILGLALPVFGCIGKLLYSLYRTAAMAA
jgi:hypothetical protein